MRRERTTIRTDFKGPCNIIVSRTTASLVEASRKMVAMNQPLEGNYQSVRNFMDLHLPLVPEEAKWVHQKGDLIALKQRNEHEPEPELAWLDLKIERLLAWLYRYALSVYSYHTPVNYFAQKMFPHKVSQL